MVLIRKDKEFLRQIAAERSDSIIDGQISVPDLLQHDGQHDHIIDRRILQQINLIEDDVRVEDEDRGGGGAAEASGGSVADLARRDSAVDIVPQVVLPHILCDFACSRLLDEGLVVQHASAWFALPSS